LQNRRIVFRVSLERKVHYMAEKTYKEYWRDIKIGWTEKQVRVLLGGPDKIAPGKMETTVWTYGQWPLAGKVTFREGKVVGLKLPFLENQTSW